MTRAAVTDAALSSPADTTVVRVQEAPIDLGALQASVRRSGSGAVVTFEGVVRDHDEGKGVLSLEYEAHPEAIEILDGLVERLAAELPVAAIAVAHRVGHLVVGDLAFVVAVSSAHRREAFAACLRIVDEVKAGLPVWKRQHFADGTRAWVNAHHA